MIFCSFLTVFVPHLVTIGYPNGPFWGHFGVQFCANKRHCIGLGPKVVPRLPKGSLLSAFGSYFSDIWDVVCVLFSACGWTYSLGIPVIFFRYFLSIPSIFLRYSFDTPQVFLKFLKYSLGIPQVFLRYSVAIPQVLLKYFLGIH